MLSREVGGPKQPLMREEIISKPVDDEGRITMRASVRE